MKVRWFKCFRVALILLFLVPYIQLIPPPGTMKAREEAWLADAVEYLERQRLLAIHPDDQALLDYTLKHYSQRGRFGVRFHPSPAGAAHNVPWCPGITIDPSSLTYSPSVSAEILVHEAQHDYFPWFGHTHIRGDL
jgi:hypothetical protein